MHFNPLFTLIALLASTSASASPFPAAADGPAPTPTSGTEYWCWVSPACVSAYKSIQACYNTLGGISDPNDSSQSKAGQFCICDPKTKGRLAHQADFDACSVCFRGTNPRTDEASLEEWQNDGSLFCGTNDPSVYLFLAQMLKFMAVAHTPMPYTQALSGPITVVTTLSDLFTPHSGLNEYPASSAASTTADPGSESSAAVTAPAPPPPPSSVAPAQTPGSTPTPTPSPTVTSTPTPVATGIATPKVTGGSSVSKPATSTTLAGSGGDAVVTQTRSLIYNPSLLPSLLPSFWTHWLKPGRWPGQHQEPVTITASNGQPMLVVQPPAGGNWRKEKKSNVGMGKKSGAGRVGVGVGWAGVVVGFGGIGLWLF